MARTRSEVRWVASSDIAVFPATAQSELCLTMLGLTVMFGVFTGLGLTSATAPSVTAVFAGLTVVSAAGIRVVYALAVRDKWLLTESALVGVRTRDRWTRRIPPVVRVSIRRERIAWVEQQWGFLYGRRVRLTFTVHDAEGRALVWVRNMTAETQAALVARLGVPVRRGGELPRRNRRRH